MNYNNLHFSRFRKVNFLKTHLESGVNDRAPGLYIGFVHLTVCTKKMPHKIYKCRIQFDHHYIHHLMVSAVCNPNVYIF